MFSSLLCKCMHQNVPKYNWVLSSPDTEGTMTTCAPVSWCTRDCCVIQINSLILLQTSNIDNNPFSLLSRSTSGLYITSEHQKQVAVVLCHPGIIWLSAGSVLPEHPGQTQHHLLQPSASTKQRQTELCNFCINPIKEPRYALTARLF